MSSVGKSSNQTIFFKRVLFETGEKRKVLIDKGTVSEVIDLYKYISKHQVNNIHEIRPLTIAKIANMLVFPDLKEAAQWDQVIHVCKKILIKEDPSSDDYTKIFARFISKTNYLEKLDFALMHQKTRLPDEFNLFLRNKMGISLTITPQACLSFIYHDLNLNDTCCIDLINVLSKYFHKDQIRVQIEDTNKVSETFLLSFIEKYGIHLEQLKLSDKNLISDSGLPLDEVVEKILLKCPNLTALNLVKIPLIGTGLTNIHLCPKLEELTLSSCPNLYVFPNLTQLTCLSKFKLTFLPSFSDVELFKSFNGFLETNPERALTDYNVIYNPNAPEGVVILNKLVKEQPQLAIKYVYTLSNAGLLPIEDKETFIRAVETYCLPFDANKTLRLAVDLDDVELARKAIEAGADVNEILFFTTPLLRACKYSSSELVEFLLNNNANPKFIGGTHGHETPLSVAKRRGHLTTECFALLKEGDGGFTDEVFVLKHLAHEFSSNGLGSFKFSVDGNEFYPEGFRPEAVVSHYMDKAPKIYEELKDEMTHGRIPDGFSISNITRLLLKSMQTDRTQCEKFIDAIDTTLSSIEHCLDFSDMDVSLYKEAILIHLSSGKPLACFGVTDIGGAWKNGARNLHAWGLVIMKAQDSDKYCVSVCDRGGVGGVGGIVVNEFDEGKMLDILETYQNLTNWKSVSKSENELRKNFTNGKRIREKIQPAGTCCYYSLQSIELALLITLLTPIFDNDFLEIIAKNIKRYRTSKMRGNDLQNYLESHLPGKSPYPVNWDLLLNIYLKTKEKSKVASFKKMIVDFVLRYAGMEPNLPQKVIDSIIGVDRRAIACYARAKNATSEEERIAAISDLLQVNPKLFLDMHDFLNVKSNELIPLVLRLNPLELSKCLNKRGYALMDTLTTCIKHNINPIDLNGYADENSYKFACHIIKHVEGIENFFVIYGSARNCFKNNLFYALAKGLKNTTHLAINNMYPMDTLMFEMLAKYCPKLSHLTMTTCESVDFSAVSPQTCFPNLTHLTLETNSATSTMVNAETVRFFATFFPNVISLSFRGYRQIDAAFIRALVVACPKLEFLDLSTCANVQFDIDESFAGVFPNLTELKLNGCYKIDIQSIRAFGYYFPKLGSLELSGNHIDLQSLEEMARACPNLESLRISCLPVNAHMLNVLSTKFLKLQTLNLFNPSGVNGETILGFERNERIQVLNLKQLNHVDAGLLHHLTIAFPNVHSLNLENCNYTKTVDLRGLTSGFPHLTKLDFSKYRDFKEETIAGFKVLCPNLTTLKCHSSKLSPEGLFELANGCPQLTSLDLERCYYEKVAQREYPPIRFPNLTELNLSHTQHLIERLLELTSYCPNLLSLILIEQELIPAFFEHLAIFCPKLTSLDLSKCKKMNADMLREIATHFPNLTRFNLSGTDTDPECIQVLAQEFRNLTWLNLSSCKEISSKDLPVLATGLSKLEELNVEWGDFVDPLAIASLQSSRPNLTILN